MLPLRSYAALLTASALSCAAASTSSGGFVTAAGSEFLLDGKTFSWVGTNNYYLMYQDQYMINDVFARAAANNFSVLRTWAFLDIGHPDGSGSVDGDGSKNGIWFQAYDAATNSVVVNATNLARLDNVVATAKKYGVKLIFTLVNNWKDFGGMDQYLQWAQWADSSYTNAHHDDFYDHPLAQQYYKQWLSTLVNRVNTITGVAYKDETAVVAWELTNEARCQGSGYYPSTNNCTLNYAKYDTPPVAWKIGAWVAEMSAYLKSIDGNHLVATGDEGFFCEEYQQCPDGVDTVAFTSVPSIDFMSLHLYPNNWGKDASWGTQWITNHTAAAQSIGKPVVVGEFGFDVGSSPTQSSVYQQWTAAAASAGTNGVNFWMLCGREDDSSGNNGWYPSYDGYCIYCPESSDPKPPTGDPASCGVLAAAANARARV